MSKREIAISEVIAPVSVPLAPVSMTDGMMHMIERAARDPSFDVVKLQEMLAMYERMQALQAQRAFGQAMRAAQEEMRPVARDADNPSTKSKYASFIALDNAVRPIYTKHGFGLTFDTGEGAPELHVRVVCDCTHADGHTRSYHLDIPADGKGAKGGDVMTRTHATMSAVSYGRRGLLKMIFNIADGVIEDDDGNAAGARDLITQVQLEQVINLADEVGIAKEKICEMCEIEALAHLSPLGFNKLMRKLNLTKQLRAKKK